MSAEERYARARNQVNQMVRQATFRERACIVAMLGGIAFGFYESWDAKHLITSAKLAAAKCEPIVLDEDGRRLHAAPMSSQDMTKVDGMVFGRLTDVVGCIRGLDSNPKLVSRCWIETTPLFVDKAAAKLNEYRAAEFASAKQIRDRIAKESIDVVVRAWDKPDDDLKGRYWLRWTEQHRYPDGKVAGDPETWSGTFDVELVIPDGRDGTWNPVLVTDWSVRRDVVHGS